MKKLQSRRASTISKAVCQVTNGHLSAEQQAMFPTIINRDEDEEKNAQKNGSAGVNRTGSGRRRQMNSITPIEMPDTLSGW